MSWALATVLIVALSFSVPLMKLWTDHRRRSVRHSDSDEPRLAATEAEVAELRQRVETLERILTDDRHQLEREFEDLDNGR